MTKPSSGGFQTSSPPASSTDRSLDAAEFARVVGKRVTELVEEALEHSPHAPQADPNAMAEVIVDLVVEKVADPDRSELADLVGPFWTAQHTRRVLDLSRPSMSERRKTGSLLALKTSDGDFFYPVSQFEKRDGKVQVKPALREFMMVLRDRDPWTIAVLTRTPAPELGNLAPLDWIRKGRNTQALREYAEVLKVEYAR